MADCLRAGAACCLSERDPRPDERPCVRVDSTLRAIGALAAWHRSRFQIPVVGVTGSVGKTTTKEMLAAVLSVEVRRAQDGEELQQRAGRAADAAAGWTTRTRSSVVEMGISDFGEMSRLTRMVRPKRRRD